MSNTAATLSRMGILKVFGESSHMTDASANGIYLQTMPIDPSSLAPEVLLDEHMRQVDTSVARVLGAYGGTITTTHYVHGFSSSVPAAAPQLYDATDSANSTAWEQLVAILASGLGNYKQGGFITGGTVSKSGTPTDTVTEDDLTSFTAGEPVCWATAATPLAYYVGWLTEIDVNGSPTPDDGHLLQTTPPHDPQGTKLWGASPVIWTPGTPEMDPYHQNASNTGVSNGAGGKLTSPAASWTLDLLGHASDQRIKCYGARPIGVKYTFTERAAPMLEITWGVADWESVGLGGEPAAGTYSFPQYEAVLNSYMAWGATAASSIPWKALEIDIGISRNPMSDPSKASGVGGWFTASRTPRVSMQIYRQHNNEVDKFEAQTGTPWTFQHGSQPGKLIAFCMPNARLAEWPGHADDNGAVMSSIVLEGDFDSGDDGSASEITAVDTAFRVAYI